MFVNSEDPAEMLQNAAFHQGLHCLLRHDNQFFRGRNFVQYFLEIITCYSTVYMYTMDHPDFILCSFCYTRFFVRKIGYINFVPKSVRCPSVRAYVCLSVRSSVTFLVIVSSPKPLGVETSNFVGA